MPPVMTPQERIRLAQDALRLAKDPRVPEAKRRNLRRVAHNVVACNMFEAQRRLGLIPPRREHRVPQSE